MRQSEISLGDPAFKSETGSEQLSHKMSSFKAKNLVCDLQLFNRVQRAHRALRGFSLGGGVQWRLLKVCQQDWSGVQSCYHTFSGYIALPQLPVTLEKMCCFKKNNIFFPPGRTKAWQLQYLAISN